MDEGIKDLWIIDTPDLRYALEQAAQGQDIELIILELAANSDPEDEDGVHFEVVISDSKE